MSSPAKKRRFAPRPETSAVDDSTYVKWDNCARNLICPLCRGPFAKPTVLVPCGHSYCSECIDVFFKQPFNQRKCPMCREPASARAPNYVLNSICAHLSTKCDNPGCGWVGEICEKDAHLRTCGHNMITCGYCGEAFKRQDAVEHCSGPASSRRCYAANFLSYSTTSESGITWTQIFGRPMGPLSQIDSDRLSRAYVPDAFIHALGLNGISFHVEGAVHDEAGPAAPRWSFASDWYAVPEQVQLYLTHWMSQAGSFTADDSQEPGVYASMVNSFSTAGRAINQVEAVHEVLAINRWDSDCRRSLWMSPEFMLRKGCLLLVDPVDTNAVNSCVPRIVTEEVPPAMLDRYDRTIQSRHRHAIMPIQPAFKQLFYREHVEVRMLMSARATAMIQVLPLWAVLAALGGEAELRTNLANGQGRVITYLRGDEASEAIVLYICPMTGFMILAEQVVDTVLLLTHVSNPLIYYVPSFVITDRPDREELFYSIAQRRVHIIQKVRYFMAGSGKTRNNLSLVLPSGCVQIIIR